MFTNKEEFKKEFERRVVQKYGREVCDSHITEKYDILGRMAEPDRTVPRPRWA